MLGFEMGIHSRSLNRRLARRIQLEFNWGMLTH
jgi:hypothetical protein